jgi:hypothetical protein
MRSVVEGLVHADEHNEKADHPRPGEVGRVQPERRMEAACRFESSLKLLAQSSDPAAVVANYFYGKSAVTTKADFSARCVPPTLMTIAMI